VQFIPFVLVIAIFYVIILLPMQRKQQKVQQFQQGLKVGDRVATIGGILGRVLTLDDEEATVETTPGTILRIRRGAIATRLDEATTVATTDDGPLVDEG
jgi:preprotein translocase subunit YajC